MIPMKSLKAEMRNGKEDRNILVFTQRKNTEEESAKKL